MTLLSFGLESNNPRDDHVVVTSFRPLQKMSPDGEILRVVENPTQKLSSTTHLVFVDLFDDPTSSPHTIDAMSFLVSVGFSCHFVHFKMAATIPTHTFSWATLTEDLQVYRSAFVVKESRFQDPSAASEILQQALRTIEARSRPRDGVVLLADGINGLVAQAYMGSKFAVPFDPYNRYAQALRSHSLQGVIFSSTAAIEGTPPYVHAGSPKRMWKQCPSLKRPEMAQLFWAWGSRSSKMIMQQEFKLEKLLASGLTSVSDQAKSNALSLSQDLSGRILVMGCHDSIYCSHVQLSEVAQVYSAESIYFDHEVNMAEKQMYSRLGKFMKKENTPLNHGIGDETTQHTAWYSSRDSWKDGALLITDWIMQMQDGISEKESATGRT